MWPTKLVFTTLYRYTFIIEPFSTPINSHWKSFYTTSLMLVCHCYYLCVNISHPSNKNTSIKNIGEWLKVVTMRHLHIIFVDSKIEMFHTDNAFSCWFFLSWSYFVVEWNCIKCECWNWSCGGYNSYPIVSWLILNFCTIYSNSEFYFIYIVMPWVNYSYLKFITILL